MGSEMCIRDRSSEMSDGLFITPMFDGMRAVIMESRAGTQSGQEVYILSKDTPLRAIRSRFGVSSTGWPVNPVYEYACWSLINIRISGFFTYIHSLSCVGALQGLRLLLSSIRPRTWLDNRPYLRKKHKRRQRAPALHPAHRSGTISS